MINKSQIFCYIRNLFFLKLFLWALTYLWLKIMVLRFKKRTTHQIYPRALRTLDTPLIRYLLQYDGIQGVISINTSLRPAATSQRLRNLLTKQTWKKNLEIDFESTCENGVHHMLQFNIDSCICHRGWMSAPFSSWVSSPLVSKIKYFPLQRNNNK